MLCKEIQKRDFSEEHAQLGNEEVVSNKGKLRQLSPYLDEGALIRIGGSIKNAAIPDTTKHQIILPRKHRLVQQIIKHYKNKSHDRTEYILSELRQVYWILNARTAIKKISKQCLHCRKMKGKLVTPYMADLPNVRLD